ncbi:endonuclease/exonuclease/phosphatase family protein [Pseudobacteriovorax antillogorgiicola]|nr:endonuclease/exonuclease/phosphatase family protein [Pseudobacteriovorax antillogorgiicola]
MKYISSTLLSVLLLTTACVETSTKDRPDVGDYNPPDSTEDTGPREEPLFTKSIGTSSTFEIATWNIENFPKSTSTVPTLAEIMKSWQLDLVAVQEIESGTELIRLADSLDGYQSLISEGGTFMKLGFLYRTDSIEVISQKDLFKSQGYIFPRPALEIQARIKQTDEVLTIISVHLKAKGDKKSQERRVAANKMLKDYVDTLISKDPNINLVILGDFNSQLDQPEMSPWTVGSGFEVETAELWEDNFYSYFVGRKSLIDHIVTRNFDLKEVKIATPYEDLQVYEEAISDHLPVVGISY